MRFSVLLVFIGLSVQVMALPIDSLRTEQKNGKWFVIHKVDAGETVFAITKRYGAQIKEVVKHNKIEDYNIDIGQILEVPIASPKTKVSSSEIAKPTIKDGIKHIVQAGETLFSLGRLYEVDVEDIKKWNQLETSQLDIEQVLWIKKKTADSTETKEKTGPPIARGRKHYVQQGENIEKIANKRNVHVDSLRKWNDLRGDVLKIGQILWYRKYDRSKEDVNRANTYGKKVEEGMAMPIAQMESTNKYLALHKTLPTGTLLEVRNLMNNKKVFVRVVGQLPDTGVNHNVIVRLTPWAFKKLGILDAKARVELIYYE